MRLIPCSRFLREIRNSGLLLADAEALAAGQIRRTDLAGCAVDDSDRRSFTRHHRLLLDEWGKNQMSSQRTARQRAQPWDARKPQELPTFAVIMLSFGQQTVAACSQRNLFSTEGVPQKPLPGEKPVCCCDTRAGDTERRRGGGQTKSETRVLLWMQLWWVGAAPL